MFRLLPFIPFYLMLLFGSSSANASGLNWKVLHSDHFNIHFEEAQQPMVEYILPLMIEDLRYIEDKIGYRLSGRIDVFIYPSNEAYLNSLRENPLPAVNTIDGGVVHIRGFDINLCYTGNKAELLRDLRIGIGENLISEMLFGGTTQERIKYHTVLQLPQWFIRGLAEYLALGWDSESDGDLRDLFLNKKLGHFNLMSPENQALVGHSLWRYIDERKGDLSIPRILYLVRLTRKLETALYFVFNVGVREIYADWYRYNSAVYAHELNRRIPSNSEDLRWHIAKHNIGQVYISQDQKDLLYVMSEPGLSEVRLWNRETQLNRLLYSVNISSEARFISKLGIVTYWDGKQSVWLADNIARPGELIQINKQGEVQETFNHPFSTIRAIASAEGRGELLLSAVRDGKTDIYLFNTLTESTRQVTDDWNDECELFYDVNGNFYYSAQVYKDAYHPSNSPSQSDIFYCIRGISDSLLITNLTSTPNANEHDPVKLSQSELSYLSDANGISNAYLFTLDPPGKAITNYRYGILDQQISPDKTLIVELMRLDDHFELFASSVEPGQVQIIGNLGLTQTMKIQLEKQRAAEEQVVQDDTLVVNKAISYPGSFFQTDFPVPNNVDSMELIEDEPERSNWFEIGEHSGYRFRIDRVYTQLDNSYFGNDLFPVYLSPGEQLKNPFGAVLGVGIADQRHMHRLTGLMRSNISLSSVQFRLNYRFNQYNHTHEADVWRSSALIRSFETYYRNRSLQLKLASNLALNDRFNFAVATQIRKDELMPLATNREALLMEVRNVNMRDLKAGIHYHKASMLFKGEKRTELNLDVNGTESSNTFGGNVAISANIRRPLTPAFQYHFVFQSGFSFGNFQRLFILGGLTQEFRADYNSENPLYYRNTGYIQPVFGMRVFPRNTRNGNSHALFTNTFEFRLDKVVRTHALGSRWLTNSSLLAFADLGSAWFGLNPWSLNNPRNLREFSDGVLDIRVYNVRSPFVFAAGSGLKTRIYDYTLSYTLGWGFDNGVWNKAVSQVKLGIDF